MEYNLFDLASNLSTQGETLADVQPLRGAKGVVRAAFDFSLATNFTNFAAVQAKSFLGDEEMLNEEQLKELGLKGDKPLTRAQANFKLKAKFYENEFNKALAVSQSGTVGNISKSIGGALAGALFDPIFLLVSAGTSVGISAGLKTVKLLPVIQRASRLTRLSTRVGLYGGAEAALNIKAGKLLATHLEHPYSDLNAYVDGAVGLVFGTAFSPGFRLSKGNAKIVNKINEVNQSQKLLTYNMEIIEPKQIQQLTFKAKPLKDVTPEIINADKGYNSFHNFYDDFVASSDDSDAFTFDNLFKAFTKNRIDTQNQDFSFWDDFFFGFATNNATEFLQIQTQLKTLDLNGGINDIIKVLHNNTRLLNSTDIGFASVEVADIIRLNAKNAGDLLAYLNTFYGYSQPILENQGMEILNLLVPITRNISKNQAKIIEWFVKLDQGPKIHELYSKFLMDDIEAAKVFTQYINEAIDKNITKSDDFLKLFEQSKAGQIIRLEIFGEEPALQFTEFKKDLINNIKFNSEIEFVQTKPSPKPKLNPTTKSGQLQQLENLSKGFDDTTEKGRDILSIIGSAKTIINKEIRPNKDHSDIVDEAVQRVASIKKSTKYISSNTKRDIKDLIADFKDVSTDYNSDVGRLPMLRRLRFHLERLNQVDNDDLNTFINQAYNTIDDALAETDQKVWASTLKKLSRDLNKVFKGIK